MNMFFYGSLRHGPLLSIVLDRDAATLDATPARLRDHAVHWAEGEAFPILLAAPGEVCEGLLVRGLDDADRARIGKYEGESDYFVAQMTVETAAVPEPAQVFLPTPGHWAAGPRWTLADWQDRMGAFVCRVATEIMHDIDNRTPQDIDRLYPMMAMRAQGWVNARNAPHREPLGVLDEGDVTQVTLTRPYVGYFVIEEHELRHRRFDGGTSPLLHRTVFAATDAAIVLPYDPVRDRVLLVEQFRMGPHARGDRRPWVLEPIAGRIDAGETPEGTAYREALEEAGLALRGLELISSSYPSPGESTGFFYLYVGLADLPDDAAGLGGLLAENEDIRSHVLSFDDAMALVDADQLSVMPTVLALNWLARHRDRLRRSA